MQIVVTDPDSLPAARREVDAELDTVEAAASRFRARFRDQRARSVSRAADSR